MILIDEPFVSEFLIETIKTHEFPIVATPIAKELIPLAGLNWKTEEEAIQLLHKHPSTSIYSNSENALDWVTAHNPQGDLSRQIKLLKDKSAFRSLTQNLFPDFYYQTLLVEELQKINPRDLPFPLVVKPSIGFFSIGVHILHNEEDWNRICNLLTDETLTSDFPNSVLDTSQFILEQYLSGEEYAIDYYHDRSGQVVILNIWHHLFSSKSDTSDRVYITSKAIIEKNHDQVKDFLTSVGESINLRNFPAHAEVRINEQGVIQPIEINPLRFGGWCTTADMMGIALGFNPYTAFMLQRKPNWDAIFRGREDKLYSIVVLDKPAQLDDIDMDYFHYDLLLADFENPILLRKMDIYKHPVFGFLFTETSAEHVQELTNILTSDLSKYIIKKH